jgi:hypothetical protein
MNLLLALSCLQGRPLREAAAELLALEPDGLQLTPGNIPREGDDAWLSNQRARVRTHHGFTWSAMRRSVWSSRGELVVDSDSVHPPTSCAPDALPGDAVLEVMIPGQALGTGDAVDTAMDLGLRLAVDVSHVFIQLSAGAMRSTTWSRLRSYAAVEEIHVSDNDGRHDLHAPISARTFGLAWARERAEGDTPVVLECYMHRLADDERQRQVDILRGLR